MKPPVCKTSSLARAGVAEAGIAIEQLKLPLSEEHKRKLSVAEAGIAIEQLKLSGGGLGQEAIKAVAEAGIAIEQLKLFIVFSPVPGQVSLQRQVLRSSN